MTLTAVPRATYRVQLHQDFTFDDAAALAPYLADLGFSHLYASPVMAARPGSTHGYDVVDHNRFNPELGGEEGFERLVAALHAHELGLILDIVPNHVGIGPDNAAWMDVLEWGQRSPHAEDFDIDWKSSRRNLEGKVLLPVLGDQFGAVLERGEIALKLDAGNGRISAWYYDNRLPISPLDYAALLAPAAAAAQGASARRLASLLRDFETLAESPAIRDTADSLCTRLAELAGDDADLRAAIETALAGMSGRENDRASWDALGELLDRQSYRAAFWRTSSDEINYRRFFDINDLAGLRVERQALFDAMHLTTLRLVSENKVQGLRIDHIDGLFDPAEYAQRLQAAAGGVGGGPFYILLEKILAPHEDLPESWPVAGTTGYDTLNLVGGLFVDPASERPLSTIYRRFSGRRESFEEILHAAKKRIVQVNLASEMGVLANAVQTLSASQWRSRDFTYAAIRSALEELVARFPVYRTYLDLAGTLSTADRRMIEWALGSAKKHAGPIDTSVFDFIGRILTGELADQGAPGAPSDKPLYPPEAVRRAAMRFQQLSGPAMAKGLEDTSFYRYFRLIAHNEVGGDPRRYAVTPALFHKANEVRRLKRPLDMIGGSTHDTKRGEDARLRIAALSGLTKEWGERVAFWARCNRRLHAEVNGEAAPDRNHEYYFYQTLIGAWPATQAIDDAAGLAELAERVDGALLKAVREGKERSSWTQPDEQYEKALSGFVRQTLTPGATNLFLADFARFAGRVAWLGALSSLSQTLIRLTMPGVPDTYRGAEGWELSMVDPDNRRPVDYPACQAQAATLPGVAGDAAALRALVENWPDARVKLFVLRAVLNLRRELPELFAAGRYLPLAVSGTQAESLVAYARRLESQEIVVLAPRLWPRLATAPEQTVDWGDTVARFDESADFEPGEFEDLFTGRRLRLELGGVGVGEALAGFPVALLRRR